MVLLAEYQLQTEAGSANFREKNVAAPRTLPNDPDLKPPHSTCILCGLYCKGIEIAMSGSGLGTVLLAPSWVLSHHRDPASTIGCSAASLTLSVLHLDSHPPSQCL